MSKHDTDWQPGDVQAVPAPAGMYGEQAQPAEAEGVEVVAYVGCQARMTTEGWENGEEYLVFANQASDADKRYDVPLMTVAQHLAALSAVTAERDAVRAVLEGAQYPNIDRLKALTIEQCRQVGETVMRLTIEAQTERDQLRAAISDPESVFVNMKRGTIAKPSLRSMIDLYGEVVNGDEAHLLEIAKLRAEVEGLRSDALIGTDAYRATVYVLRRAACDEVFGVAKLQRVFLLDWQSAERLLKEMVRRGDVEQCAGHGWRFPGAAMAAKEA